jgi:hypothetical protein
VTTAVPAEPVKPLIHARRSKHVGTYSEKCGSCDGTTNASTEAAAMRARSAASFAQPSPAMAGEAAGLSPSAPSATTAVSPASALARDADPRRRRAVAGVAEERRLGCARTARLENAETSCRARGEEVRRRCGTVTRLVSGVTRSIEPRVGSSDVTTTIGETREEKSLQIRRSGAISFKRSR